MRQVGEVETYYSQDPYTQLDDPQLQLLKFSQRMRATSSSPAWESCTGKTTSPLPRAFVAKGQCSLLLEQPASCDKQTPFLKGKHKISHTLRFRIETIIYLNQTHLPIFESLLERQETTETHPGGIDTGSSHLGAHLTTRTLALVRTILEFSLQFISVWTLSHPPTNQHQSLDAPSQTASWVGHGPPPIAGHLFFSPQ